MKFVMTQAVCEAGMTMLNGKADVYIANNPDPNTYLDEMKDADALIVRIAKCDGNAIDQSPNLKVIGKTGVGVDAIDVAKATSLGIPVVITPGANSRSVAEHTVGFMFALSKNLCESDRELRNGNWKIRDAGKAIELEGKSVGIIGFGSIGRMTGMLCKTLGMDVFVYDPVLSQQQVEAEGCKYVSDLDDLLRDSDFVTIHVPLNEKTMDMISNRELRMMKVSAYIINCSRGGIINERDLVEALENRVIAGAALDVFCEEPLQMSDGLLDCPNLIISPHAAAQTKEAVEKMATMCVSGCLAVCEGKKWPYVADSSVYEHSKWKEAEWAF
jgi:D-3-phosphoglycerate dehydrogenase